MKRLNPKINAYCTYCKAEGKEKIKALWVTSNWDKSNRACEDHKHLLPKLELDNHLSEADYQTWMRL